MFSREQFQAAGRLRRDQRAQVGAVGEQGWAPVDRADERPHLCDRKRQPCRHRRAGACASGATTGCDRPPWFRGPGHAQQHLLWRAVHVDRKIFAVLERPGELGVDVERQHALVIRRALHLLRRKAVEAHQPVGLVQAMFAHQRRTLERQHGACVGDRREGRIIDAAKPEPVVERARLARRCRGRSRRRRRRSSASIARPARTAAPT